MGLFDIFKGGKNPAESAMPYLNRIPGETKPYLEPYFEAGKGVLPSLQEQYGDLLNDPGALMNRIGGSYKQSPGLNFAIQQALQGAGHAAAAGGMAGSPQHELQNMGLASNLASQDYNNWLGQALGLYGQGLHGQQGLAGMGQQAGMSLADMISQSLAQQGNLAYQGQAQQNENQAGLFGGLAKGIGSLAAFNPWGMFGDI